MNFISNFYKFIVIILLIIILIKLINNIYESFTTSVATPSQIVEDKIKFKLIKNNNNSVDITWDNNANVTKYVIITYINNTGPYIKIIDGAVNKYTMTDVVKNIKYKIGVLGIFKKLNKTGSFDDVLSNIKDNIKEFNIDSLSNELNIKYVSSFKTNILCDGKGQHKLVSGKDCNLKNRKPNIIAMNSLNNNDYFSNDDHEKLMDDITKQLSSDYKIEFKI
tara:strand:+ start:78 stop:740 length:663 start_codon:yes stop_codon:yes gene_type:complete